MKRLFIKQKEIMQITGWGRTKTGTVCTTIRDAHQYPINRNDIEVNHLSDFLGIKEQVIQEKIEALYGNHKDTNVP